MLSPDSSALSRTPAEAAGLWTKTARVAHSVSIYPVHFAGTKFIAS